MAVTKAKPKQKGPSRLIIYTVVGAVAVYAYVLQATPATKSSSKNKHTTKSQTTASSDGITDQDLKARFPRYMGGLKDPFVPAMAMRNNAPGVPGSGGGEWSLTGVNTIDGVTTATVENPASSDSEFLKVGDRWNGLLVLAVNPDSVVFQNALGQETRLSFPGNDQDNASEKAETETSTGSTRGLAGLPPVQPLPSITILPMQIPGPPSGNGGAPGNDQGGGGGDNAGQ